MVERSVSELEASLRRLPYTYRIPPSALDQLLESYASHTQIADAAQRENAQRTFLLAAILGYTRPELALKPGEGMQVSVLMQTALTMPIRTGSLVGTAAQRRQALDDLLGEIEQDTYAPEDRDYYRRLALSHFIREHAADPRILEVEEPGKPIEYLNEDELCCPRCGAEDVDNSRRISPQSGNSGDFVTFACRQCGYCEENMDGDTAAGQCAWARRRR
jgi:hypothetical protein